MEMALTCKLSELVQQIKNGMEIDNSTSQDQVYKRMIGLRCYCKPAFSDWLWSRKIKGVRYLHDLNCSLYNRWQVRVRNWFWHEWVSVRFITLVAVRYDN